MTERHFASLPALYRSEEADEALRAPGFSAVFVRGEGKVGAPLMLIGEQPGNQEDLSGRPFVGPAGRLLDQCLAGIGVDRATTFVTNAVKRFKFTLRGKRRLHQTPNAGDIARYRWWLKEEVRLVHPTVVVALGRTALRARDGASLKSDRGTLLSWEERTLLPTIHPSYLLRLRDQRDDEEARFREDLRTAARAAGLVD
ncbi:UdgX family uracil-DNA binding protein [Sphingomonas sp.]|uniref:UdgX family uracil-DNA binding protein n=1 Tax=Sphingomonas sp. TaxID=28214 RepID=UPI00257978A2|nr:UdgX family uracil-DNA binding protein [Sphingomonas sp.]